MVPSPNESPDPARAALDQAFSAAYEELRRLASAVRRHERAQTLNPTALVHEAWLKLARSPAVAGTSSLHFKRIAARAMRQVLVEAARRRHAVKRGGPGASFVTLDESLVAADSWEGGLLALDVALDELARLEPRQARVVECRFFGGLDVAETAAALDMSATTVERDWRAARAWLALAVARER